jgi:hypothetical protein
MYGPSDGYLKGNSRLFCETQLGRHQTVLHRPTEWAAFMPDWINSEAAQA